MWRESLHQNLIVNNMSLNVQKGWGYHTDNKKSMFPRRRYLPKEMKMMRVGVSIKTVPKNWPFSTPASKPNTTKALPRGSQALVESLSWTVDQFLQREERTLILISTHLFTENLRIDIRQSPRHSEKRQQRSSSTMWFVFSQL